MVETDSVRASGCCGESISLPAYVGCEWTSFVAVILQLHPQLQNPNPSSRLSPETRPPSYPIRHELFHLPRTPYWESTQHSNHTHHITPDPSTAPTLETLKQRGSCLGPHTGNLKVRKHSAHTTLHKSVLPGDTQTGIPPPHTVRPPRPQNNLPIYSCCTVYGLAALASRAAALLGMGAKWTNTNTNACTGIAGWSISAVIPITVIAISNAH